MPPDHWQPAHCPTTRMGKGSQPQRAKVAGHSLKACHSPWQSPGLQQSVGDLQLCFPLYCRGGRLSASRLTARIPSSWWWWGIGSTGASNPLSYPLATEHITICLHGNFCCTAAGGENIMSAHSLKYIGGYFNSCNSSESRK